MIRPPVTVGLPVYNGEEYLGEAIESLRSQTFSDFRLIISDNASTDSTEEIARAAAEEDPRVEYHRHEINLGGPANYNYTFGKSESDYFMWHAHDDLRDPKFLELAFDAITESSDISVVFSRTMLIGPDGEHRHLKPRPDALMSAAPHDRLRAVITAPHVDVVLFGLIRRSLLEHTQGHGAFKGGDRVLVAELALLGRLVEIDEPLFLNRDHPGRYTRFIPMDEAGRKLKREWWNPSTRNTITLPRWKSMGSYVAAAKRHPLTAAERLSCYASIAGSLFDNRAYVSKQLVGEVLDATPQLLGRLVRTNNEP